MMKRPTLVPDWRGAHRWLSVRLAAVIVAWGMLPADTQAAIVEWAGVPASRVPALLGLLVIAGRLIQQGVATDKKDEEEAK